MPLKLLFLTFFICMGAFPCETSELKPISFGINAGFPGEVILADKALDQLVRKGIKKIRIYEPWHRKFNNDKQQIAALIKTLTDRGFEVLICFSNLPYEEVSFDELYRKNRENIYFKKNQIKKKYGFSNRFPPIDLAGFRQDFEELLKLLAEMGLMEKLSFEIGNEPDSYNYFWGSAADFREVYEVMRVCLQKYTDRIYCCAMTANFFVRPNEKTEDFSDFIRQDRHIGKDVPFSFHYYHHTMGGWTDIEDFEHDKFPGSIITEYGIYARVTKDQTNWLAILNSAEYVNRLAKVMYFAWQNDIRCIYIWKLMDNKHKNGRPGLFDISAQPKPSWHYFMAVHKLARDGFSAHKDDNRILIRGRKHTLYLALADHNTGLSSRGLKLKSSKGLDSRELRAGDWFICRNRRRLK